METAAHTGVAKKWVQQSQDKVDNQKTSQSLGKQIEMNLIEWTLASKII